MVAWSCGVVIGTFGDPEWADRGVALAERKIAEGFTCVHVHGSSLAEARNIGALYLDTDFVVFLDADDDLDAGYCEAMSKAAMTHGTGTIYQPATRGRVDGILDDFPYLIPQTNLYHRNYLVIGCGVSRLDFLHLNGFRELEALEDWDLWIRMVIRGARVVRVPEAVYIVNVSANSRNTNSAIHGQIYRQIQAEYAEHVTTLQSHTCI